MYKEDFFALVFVVVGVLLTVISLITLASVASYYTDKSACNTVHEVTGQQVNMSFAQGCLVYHEGVWMTKKAAIGNKQEVTIK